MLFLVGVKFWRYNSTQLFPFNSLIISLRIKFHLLTWNHWPLSTKFSTKIEFFIHFFKKAKSTFKEDITNTEKIRSDKFVYEMGVTSDFFSSELMLVSVKMVVLPKLAFIIVVNCHSSFFGRFYSKLQCVHIRMLWMIKHLYI